MSNWEEVFDRPLWCVTMEWLAGWLAGWPCMALPCDRCLGLGVSSFVVFVSTFLRTTASSRAPDESTRLGSTPELRGDRRRTTLSIWGAPVVADEKRQTERKRISIICHDYIHQKSLISNIVSYHQLLFLTYIEWKSSAKCILICFSFVCFYRRSNKTWYSQG